MKCNTWSRMDEKPQSGILEGELETESEEAVQTGCLDCIRQTQITALALYSTDAGNSQVRFDEGSLGNARDLLYHV